jgi:hypothetical protein
MIADILNKIGGRVIINVTDGSPGAPNPVVVASRLQISVRNGTYYELREQFDD